MAALIQFCLHILTAVKKFYYKRKYSTAFGKIHGTKCIWINYIWHFVKIIKSTMWKWRQISNKSKLKSKMNRKYLTMTYSRSIDVLKHHLATAGHSSYLQLDEVQFSGHHPAPGCAVHYCKRDICMHVHYLHPPSQHW